MQVDASVERVSHQRESQVARIERMSLPYLYIKHCHAIREMVA